MLAILSPAKSLDYESALATRKFSEPAFVADSAILIDSLRQFDPKEISSLMGISDNLAELNHRRFAEWQPEFPKQCARPALLTFSGDVYLGLQGATLGERDFTWAQKHLRILSGLHGLLRPLDRIRPYRLEMGTQLKTERGKNLYQFWGDQVTDALNTALNEQSDNVLINLASDEYYRVLQPDRIEAQIIKIHFRDWKSGKYKFLSFFAKRARGSMARFIIDKRVKTLQGLRAFNYDGYQYNSDLSNGDDWVFTRKQD
jgi:uncharacterized protein